MLDRAQVVHENFLRLVAQAKFPLAYTKASLSECGLSANDFGELFQSQMTSRHFDLTSRELKTTNQSFYTIGSSGHEGNAAIARVFRVTDPAFLHYRSGAFVVGRARKKPEIDIIYDIMLSFVAASEDPISQGRHKVLGSLPLNIPPQTSTIASHLPKSVGMAFAIRLAKELQLPAQYEYDSVVICSFGDASFNHSVSQGAINAAQWIARGSYPLPLLFVCEDNGIGLSVPTPNNWIENNIKSKPYINYISCDGLHLGDVYRAAQQAEYLTRVKQQPVFLHMKTVRLLGHAGSDIEMVYRTMQAIEKDEANDPLLHSARIAVEEGIYSPNEVIELYKMIKNQVDTAAAKAVQRPKLTSCQDVMASVVPGKRKSSKRQVKETERKTVFADKYAHLQQSRNLCQSINLALTDALLQYPNTIIFGEDVARKGGVYHVTDGLMQRFGQRRVFDSLLDETTILGTALGLAQNGFLPIPEIQFLAYLHNAEDQLRGEAATLSFFSSGQYTNPLLLRIAGLAYQKGFGGHFHNDNGIGVLRDIPGIIVATPSNGHDAVQLLRECLRLVGEEQRVVVFLEPIALYMTKDLHTNGDNLWLSTYPQENEKIKFGDVGVYGDDNADLTIISYANGYFLSRQAQKILQEKHKINVKIIDLRWLVPLPEKELLKHLIPNKPILIVDETRISGSVSEGLVALLVDNQFATPQIKRYCGADCFIPLGNSWQYVLPSRDGIVDHVIGMLQSKHKSGKTPCAS